MAVYKVIQDIEAEDKLLGPLTLKQFIFAVISIGFVFAAFMAATKIKIYAAIPFIPFIVVPAILAAPLSRDQPTDVWLAAQIRFYIKPRKRIWDQSGIKELVTITVPKKIEKIYTDGLSQHEVKSRLRALADTIDSRGWAIKNVDVSTYSSPQLAYANEDYDRLIDPASLPKAVNDYDVPAYEDILDDTNPTSQHFAQMVNDSSIKNREAAIAKMKAANSADDFLAEEPPTTQEDLWFLKEDSLPQDIDPNSAMFTDQIIEPGQESINSDEIPESFNNKTTDSSISEDETELLKRIKTEKSVATNPHHKTIKTPEQIAKEQQAEAIKQAELQKAQAVTPHKNPDIVRLATESGDDLSIETIAKMAKQKAKKAKDDGEVVINLR